MTQINPPFDGSPPCPMCNQEIRGVSALAHNMLNRWRKGDNRPESKFWSKLDDLRLSMQEPPTSDNAEVAAHLDAIADLVAEYAKHDRPHSDAAALAILPSITAAVDKVRDTIGPVNKLSEAHFDDARHASGRPNILREQRGWSEERGGDYDFWVKEALPAAGPTLIHKVCGVRLVVHEHFRERMRRDPAFYGQIWCPTCGMNLPLAQFECRVA